MPGRPKYAAFCEIADPREAEIIGWVADGVNLREIMSRLTDGHPLLDGIGLVVLYQWRDADAGRAEAYSRARRLSAESRMATAEDALTRSTHATLAIDKERARLATFLASRYNRELYGDDNKLNVVISLPDMHLQALRELGGGPAPSLPAPAAALPAVEDADFEVVE